MKNLIEQLLTNRINYLKSQEGKGSAPMANKKLRPTGLYFLGNSLAIYRRPVYPIVSAFVLLDYYVQ